MVILSSIAGEDVPVGVLSVHHGRLLMAGIRPQQSESAARLCPRTAGTEHCTDKRTRKGTK